jgi:hypothetical protein
MRIFAKRLIACETNGNQASEAIPASFPVFETLRPHLAMLMGNGGSRAVLSRALALAFTEVPWLHAVHVKSDGTLEGLVELKERLKSEDISEGRTVLLAQLLGLLVAFIGESLTLQLARDAWPDVSLDNLEFD